MPHRGDRRFGGALHALPAMAIIAALTALVCVLAFGGSEKPGNVGAGSASTSVSAPTSSTAASTDLAAEKSSELASEAALRSAAALDPSPKDPDYVPHLRLTTSASVWNREHAIGTIFVRRFRREQFLARPGSVRPDAMVFGVRGGRRFEWPPGHSGGSRLGRSNRSQQQRGSAPNCAGYVSGWLR